MYYARLMGIAHCIVPQLLPIVTDPQSTLIQAPAMELLASIMKPNQQINLGGNQMPSIVQIIVPASSLQHIPVIENLNQTEDIMTSTTTTTTTTTMMTTNAPDIFIDDSLNITTTYSTTTLSDVSSTVEPLRSSISVTQSHSTSTLLPEMLPEPEKEDDIDDIQLNEDLESGDDYLENEEKVKKQRDRSDFRYVESFDSEKSIAQSFEPDPSDNETELKNVISETYQQIPSVLPVPKALSSSKDAESEDHEPPEEHQDQNISAPDM